MREKLKYFTLSPELVETFSVIIYYFKGKPLKYILST